MVPPRFVSSTYAGEPSRPARTDGSADGLDLRLGKIDILHDRLSASRYEIRWGSFRMIWLRNAYPVHRSLVNYSLTAGSTYVFLGY